MIVYVYPADTYACGSYRLIWPAEALRAQGHDVRVVLPSARGGLGGDIDTKTNTVTNVRVPPDADVIVLQRVSFAQMAQAVPHMRAKGIAVVVDMDDDLTKIDPSNPAFWAMRTDGVGRMAHHNYRNAHQACLDATLVTVSTPALLKVYAPHGRGLVIENRVPAAYLDIPHVDSATIGWPGSVHSHPADLYQLGPAVQRLVHEGASYRGVGPDFGAQLGDGALRRALGLREDPPVTGPVSMAEYPQRVAEIGVGIAPLAGTAFNSAKCLDAETRVATDRGILRITDIAPGDQVWRDGWRKVEAVEAQPEREGLAITMKSGQRVKLSREHRLYRSTTGWTVASDLIVGDELRMTPDVIEQVEMQTAPWPADSRMTRGEHDRNAFILAEDVPRVIITPRWGRFLGLFAGDGCATGTRIVFSVDGQDQDIIDLISSDISAIGLWPATEAMKTWGGEPLRRRSVGASSAHLIRFMRSLGLVEESSVRRIITVPEIIWRSPEPVVAAYLAGLFEADGTVANSGVALSTKYHAFALQVQRMLVAFGIESTICQRFNTAGGASGSKRFESWLLTIRRAGADIFASRIGFLSERKTKRLAVVTSKSHSNAYRPQTWRDHIALIEPCSINPVDIQVDGEAYAAAGFFSHNSWLKPLELMACGVPFVAQRFAEYQRLVRHTRVGLLADTPKDWYRQVGKLVKSASMREDMTEVGRAVAEDMTIEGGALLWLEAWVEALKIQRG